MLEGIVVSIGVFSLCVSSSGGSFVPPAPGGIKSVLQPFMETGVGEDGEVLSGRLHEGLQLEVKADEDEEIELQAWDFDIHPDAAKTEHIWRAMPSMARKKGFMPPIEWLFLAGPDVPLAGTDVSFKTGAARGAKKAPEGVVGAGLTRLLTKAGRKPVVPVLTKNPGQLERKLRMEFGCTLPSLDKETMFLKVAARERRKGHLVSVHDARYCRGSWEEEDEEEAMRSKRRAAGSAFGGR